VLYGFQPVGETGVRLPDEKLIHFFNCEREAAVFSVTFEDV